ncbi:MAG: phosphatase PAP2 family protein [Bryobacteraceae bacterium]
MKRIVLLMAVGVPLWCQQVEPGGGGWKTWVIGSGSQFRLAAPPDAAATAEEVEWLRATQSTLSAAGRAQVMYWDQGAPSYHWVKWLQQRILALGVNTPNATRQMALLNVAIYDALVAAWDSKYFHNRPRPGLAARALIAAPATPSYPDEFAVAGAAAAAVLSYLYPAEAAALQGMAEEAGRSRLYAGVAYPSDHLAGLQLGERVGQAVVDRARSDGSTAVWTGSVPVGPGMWVGTNPVCPLCGTWKTWVLRSGDQLRPGAPPAYNSAEKQQELAGLKAMPRPFADQAKAFFWQTGQGVITTWYDSIHLAMFEDRWSGNALRVARAYALLSVAQYDSMVACWDAKYAYWAIRPVQLDATVTTLFATPNHPSYPGAHATNSTSIAEVMAYLFPDRAAEYRAMAYEAGWSRMVAGIHYASDTEAGNVLGRRVAAQVVEWAQADGSGR